MGGMIGNRINQICQTQDEEGLYRHVMKDREQKRRIRSIMIPSSSDSHIGDSFHLSLFLIVRKTDGQRQAFLLDEFPYCFALHGGYLDL